MVSAYGIEHVVLNEGLRRDISEKLLKVEMDNLSRCRGEGILQPGIYSWGEFCQEFVTRGDRVPVVKTSKVEEILTDEDTDPLILRPSVEVPRPAPPVRGLAFLLVLLVMFAAYVHGGLSACCREGLLVLTVMLVCIMSISCKRKEKMKKLFKMLHFGTEQTDLI